MRNKPLIHILVFFGLLLSSVSCDQKPVSVAPETESGSWRVIAEGSYGLKESVDCIWGFDDGVVIVGDGLGTVACFVGTHWIDPFARLGNRVTDIWGKRPDDFYVLTEAGLYRCEGGDCTEVRAGGYAIWGEASDRLVLTDDDGIHLYDNSQWTVIDSTEGRVARGIWGMSMDDVFFASSDGLLHFDGDTVVTIPGAPDVGYTDVWGSSSSDVFVVGTEFTIVHYDGKDINVEVTGGLASFLRVWGTGPDNVYATVSDILAHYDGTSWSAIDPHPYQSYRGIWGNGTNDIYIGGYHDEVIHFDGVETELIRGIRAHQIHALWTDPLSGNLVTSEGRRMFCFDGSGWEELPANRLSDVRFLWGSSIDSLYASGCARITFYDGDHWESVTALPFLPDAVWNDNNSRAYIAGSSIVHFNGAEWVTVLDEVYGVESLHGSSPSNIYAVGSEINKGFVLRYNGDSWDYTVRDSQYNFKDVWVVSETEVYTVGFFDGVLKFDGHNWELEPLNATMRDFRALWGDSGDNIYCGGVDNLMHFDGHVWSPILERGGQIFTHLTGRSGGAVYAVVNYGDILIKE